MDLTRALRFDTLIMPPRVAFVGAGGKTSAMFQCARGLPGPVLVTATTHLGVSQIQWADQHFYDDQIDALAADSFSGVILITGPLDGTTNRISGVSAAKLECLLALAEARQIPLLIEADGSRQLPLKAPAEHEPPIPEFVDTVVVVAGLSGLGQPLKPKFVHRPEIFATLSGLQPGDSITPAALIRVLTHPAGGLKNVPAGARRVALLNQADTPTLQAQAAAIAPRLWPEYQSIIIASLQSQSPFATSTPEIYAVYEPTAAVILAAGEARRFGSPKQLLDWHGQPFIWHVAQQALRAGLNPVVVVCGEQINQIQQALTGLPIKLIHNPDWQQGQGTSVRAGVQALASVYPVPIRCPIRLVNGIPLFGGIIFLLADQPQISELLLRKLVAEHTQTLNPITAPLVDGQRANPVLFDQVTFADLLALSGEAGGRQLFSKYPVNWLPWHDDLLLLDVDTPEDYRRFLELTA